MEHPLAQTVQLAGGLSHTATWVTLAHNGDLVIDYYDFSDAAERFFGNDVAYRIVVNNREQPRLRRLLGVALEDRALLAHIQQHFADYFDLKAWLEANTIAFEQTFDAWA